MNGVPPRLARFFEPGSRTQELAARLAAAGYRSFLVGEMRDVETVKTALTAAETGHLVFSTLHTISATDSINRIIDFFPPH